jgi:HD superfamily phosphohydrolase
VPKWGLTEPQRESQPWGLASKYLAPAKTIRDGIHGDIFVTELEQIFIDTEPFERLRRVKQLGNTHLVYPSANHSRFSHSLGAVRVAQDLIDAAIDQRNNPKPVPDLFAQWEDEEERIVEGIFDDAAARVRKRRNPPEFLLTEEEARALRNTFGGTDKRIAEAVVAARLGALLHDVCHIPFGHSLEDELSILTSHDENKQRFDRIWRRFKLKRDLDRQLRDGGLYDELRGLVLSGVKPKPKMKYPFVADIVGNTICADLLDYLERDHRMAGLPVALGRRFVSAFYVSPSGDPEMGEHMILKITRGDGRERTDVVTEVLKYLRYRYELSERALVHHAKLAADAMIGKALEMWSDTVWIRGAYDHLREAHEAAGKKGRLKQPPWFMQRNITDVRDEFERREGSAARNRIDKWAIRYLDDKLSTWGDDSLLERLAEFDEQLGHPRRAEGVRELASAVRDRRLFKRIGTQHSPPQSPDWMFKTWGGADKRRELEEDAARWAGLEHRWEVLLWIPPDKMRLKPAEVLVDTGDGIMTFFEYEERGRGRGTDIYAAHRALWAVSVYLHPKYAEDELVQRKVIARLAQKMNITFSKYEKELGKQAYLWPDRLAAQVALEKETKALQPRPEEMVDDLMETVRTGQIRARSSSPDESWGSLYARYQGVAKANAKARKVR